MAHDLKFVMENISTRGNSLDVNLRIGGNNQLQFDVHYKPPNAFGYLKYTSSNLAHTQKNIAISLAKRIIRIVSENRSSRIEELCHHLMHRDHPPNKQTHIGYKTPNKQTYIGYKTLNKQTHIGYKTPNKQTHIGYKTPNKQEIQTNLMEQSFQLYPLFYVDGPDRRAFMDWCFIRRFKPKLNLYLINKSMNEKPLRTNSCLQNALYIVTCTTFSQILCP